MLGGIPVGQPTTKIKPISSGLEPRYSRAEAEKVLHQIAENTLEYQKSFADYSARKNISVEVTAGKIAEIDARLSEITTERQRLDRRLSFLLEGGNVEVAKSFRDEYMRQFSDLKSES